MFFGAFDLAVLSIHKRLDQKGFKIPSNVEKLLFRECEGHCCEEELDAVCSFFYDDFTKDALVAELCVLHKRYQSVAGQSVPSVDRIKTVLLSLSSSQRVLLSSVCHLFQLLTILPVTIATSEQSFSALHQIKSYLRSTMAQARLSHLMILHYHQETTDALDMRFVANEYIMKTETRKNLFATFSP